VTVADADGKDRSALTGAAERDRCRRDCHGDEHRCELSGHAHRQHWLGGIAQSRRRANAQEWM
jgi:hypothetical protein